MKRLTIIFIAIFLCSALSAFAQVVDYKEVPMERLIEIIKAEDELRYDETLEDLMAHPNQFVRERAALAAGRIGNKDAVPVLATLLNKDVSEVRRMAAFAIGEIESTNGADAVLLVLANLKDNPLVRARSIEAAGKIAAANEKDEKSKLLGKAIIQNLDFEAGRRSAPSSEVIVLGVTAVLRAKPKNSEETVAKFLSYSSARVRADALNTLARLRAKGVNDKAKELLQKDENAVVRSNAARVLGAAEDKTAVDLLIKAASEDSDLRVRVNAIRALIGFESKKSAEVLLDRAEVLFKAYQTSRYANPSERNELLTISSALGTILKGSNDPQAVRFLEKYRVAEKHRSTEVEIALARVSPGAFVQTKLPDDLDWQGTRGFIAGLSEAADSGENDDNSVKERRTVARGLLEAFTEKANMGNGKSDKSFPDVLSAYAKLKTNDLQKTLLDSLTREDVITRSTAANLLGDIKPETPEEGTRIYGALSNALWKARTDKLNDASLSILGALEKQYNVRKPARTKYPYMSPFISAMGSPDYLIRRKAAEIYEGFKIQMPDPMKVSNPDFKPFEIPSDIGIVKFDDAVGKDDAKSRVRGADYKKALSRKNGKWGVVLETAKGSIIIDLFPEDAPLTVDNFINLAKSGYFNGLEIHRVVPNFVVQDGDPRGDGSGGPGWQIRCEINQIPYERGMVGMALSGKDTGGSQWFVTHAPQPHLDGGYTVFGKVNEKDMKIVDNLVRGDRIISAKVTQKSVKR